MKTQRERKYTKGDYQLALSWWSESMRQPPFSVDLQVISGAIAARVSYDLVAEPKKSEFSQTWYFIKNPELGYELLFSASPHLLSWDDPRVPSLLILEECCGHMLNCDPLSATLELESFRVTLEEVIQPLSEYFLSINRKNVRWGDWSSTVLKPLKRLHLSLPKNNTSGIIHDSATA